MSTTVLIVDDCRMTRRLLCMYVREAGFDAISAENGLDALEKLGREACAIVVTDLNMPHMDGVEFTRTLKGHPVYQDIPVIILTTHNEASERTAGLEAGASTFLSKPISKHELVQEIDRLIPSKSQELDTPVV